MTSADSWLDGWSRWFYGGTPPRGETLSEPHAESEAALLDEPVLQRVVGEVAVRRQLEFFHDA